MKRWLDIEARFAALLGALLLYGACGSPTPDQPGWIEAIIGMLLCCAMTFSITHDRKAFVPLLVIGLSIPLGIAVWSGHAATLIVRDLIPFVFLCLPLFIHPRGKERAFYAACLLVGVLFAVRVLGQGLDILPARTELLYLANSPLVIVSAIVGLGSAGMDLYRRTLSLQSLVFFCGGLICLLAMLIDVQRATITAVLFSLCLLAVIGTVRAPRRMIWPLLVLLVAVCASAEIMMNAWHSMATKTALVGVNMRWQEVLAVYHHLGRDVWRVLFGIGWGGQFSSPAVGGWSVPFTHSLLTYMLLKTGMLGLAATAFALSGCVLAVVRQHSLSALALFWAILIPVFFYASYKSLDFGLVLVLALLLPRGIEFSKKTS